MMLAMRTDELAMGKEQLDAHKRGPCFCTAMSSRQQLTRRIFTAEHPRFVPLHFSVPGSAANKVTLI